MSGNAHLHGDLGNVTQPLLRNVSDTAFWAAMFRARETQHPRGLFKDPLAAVLVGQRGRRLLETMPMSEKHAWTWVTRTHLFDQHILNHACHGGDMVVNLAAGLDTRPYRLDLPATMQWIEVDMPDLLAYKENILCEHTPCCRLERVAMDLSDRVARQKLFQDLGSRSTNMMIVTEGLLIYLTEEAVATLARDLASVVPARRWCIDIASPGLLRIMMKKMGPKLEEAGAPFLFAPQESCDFFIPFGWKPVKIEGILKAAARLGRLSWGLRLLSWLPELGARPNNRPWGGICLLEKSMCQA